MRFTHHIYLLPTNFKFIMHNPVQDEMGWLGWLGWLVGWFERVLLTLGSLIRGLY